MPPVKMKGDGRKAKNPKQTFARLLGYLKPYRARLIGMVVCISSPPPPKWPATVP